MTSACYLHNRIHTEGLKPCANRGSVCEPGTADASVKCLAYSARCVFFWGLLTKVSHTRSAVSPDSPSRSVRFAAHRQPLCWNFLYHSRLVLSVGGSVWYLVWNLRCTITIDSVLANSKKQNRFLSPVLAMFCYDCPLAVKPASTPWRLLSKQTWRDSLPTDMILSAVSVLVIALPSLEVPEGLMNYSV
jgi:hypothetical protein